ncbi:tRNA pseudouridine(55) synthase TruB [Blastopirellula marina]|uniref:tRNA pseudouridine synthase B n=1 Tax=Blastopirellula marina TaxID=124 RepID=A0A2S8EYQ8_9BACT|nr:MULTISPECIES: tRNA pseudouridine(55) synthase TruB [Pirellulaceae]PQO25038.1 tRNA pseudouridine(55) synthase TruB [Blastopirellula marina]RCS40890.1 tRNA pseudouridine(55) synthase TruB [Bremerella cremea]
MHGILNINKPAGKTSRDVVNIIQRLVRPAKTGHAGTLDPLATGVLVCPVGHGTKLIEYVQRMPKTYEACFLLGRHSDTEDIEGEVQLLADPPQPTLDEIEAVLPSYLGAIQQVPPAYSALKVAGQRAYDLARQGKEVELASRLIEVYSIEILAYDYPELRMRIECGSGTYIRSLGRDIARDLGTEAVMSELVRTAIGCFRIEDAIHPDDQLSRGTIVAALQPTSLAATQLPQVTVDHEEIVRLAQGKVIEPAVPDSAEEVAAMTTAGELVAVLVPGKEGGWRTTRNFANDYL